MNLEIKFLLQILHSKDLKTATSNGVKVDYFMSPENLMVFQFIEKYAKAKDSYGQVPSLHLISTRFPNFPAGESPPDDSLHSIIYEMKDRYLRKCLSAIQDDVEQLKEVDPRTAIDYLHTAASKLRADNAEYGHLQLDARDAALSVLESVNLISDTDGYLGIPFPWEPLNLATRGMSKGEFYLIYGPAKSMKTWIALEIAVVHPFLYANARCLVVSMEMPVTQMYRRIYSRFAQVDYEHVVSGTLDAISRQRFEQTCLGLYAELSADNPDRRRNIRVIKPENAGISSVMKAVEEFDPDIVFVDGIYLLRDERPGQRSNDWKSLSHISQDLKALCHRHQVPLIGTHQANRTGVKRDVSKDNADDYSDVGMSMGPIQDADFVIRTQKVKTPEGDTHIAISLPATREVNIDGFFLDARPAVSFNVVAGPQIREDKFKAPTANEVASFASRKPALG
jgi:replicative DNA helicase